MTDSTDCERLVYVTPDFFFRPGEQEAPPPHCVTMIPRL